MPRRVLTISALLALTAGVFVYLVRDIAKGPNSDDGEDIEGTGPLLVVHHLRD